MAVTEQTIGLSIQTTPSMAAKILALVSEGAKAAPVVTAEKRETKVAAPKETKKAKPPVDEDEDDLEDLDDEDEVEDDEDEDEAEEVKPKAKGKTTKEAAATFEDVSKAFKAFTQGFDDIKKARSARAKVLSKFGVKQPSELEEDQYADVIKALKVKK